MSNSSFKQTSLGLAANALIYAVGFSLTMMFAAWVKDYLPIEDAFIAWAVFTTAIFVLALVIVRASLKAGDPLV
jgi:hypothetical protein